MHIDKILKIENYRNLSNIEVKFNANMNFIVGENNIGKTNLIELINSLINIGKFCEDDFLDIKEPIKVVFQIKYSEDEIGFFEDIFDVDNKNTITIEAIQENSDSRIEYFHFNSRTTIHYRNIKMLNFVYYSSLRSPVKELSFSRSIGTGRVLNYIMKKSLENKNIEEMDLLNKSDIEVVINDVNDKFKKINGFSSENIGAYLSDDKENIIDRLLEIGDDSGRNISKLGDGLQYSFNIFLNILELLVYLKTTKKEEDYESIFINDESGKRYLPIILGLDEPEIHQHPYRQRALIKNINKIINNENEEFLDIVKELFDVDGFIGQVFIVTHSPNILLDDYKQVIRIYEKEDNTCIISGENLNFDPEIHKHLIRSFIYFKEAMFSKSVIMVEGDTEFGAVPVFAKKLGYDLDYSGIGVIKLDGADGVLRYLNLFNSFGISAIAILDKDKMDSYNGNISIKFTEYEDFEEEIFHNYTFKNYLEYLVCIDKYTFLISYLKDIIKDFNVKEFIGNPTEIKISDDDGLDIMEKITESEIKELRKVKNAINGSILAEYVDKIPTSFENIIKYLFGDYTYDE